MKILINYMLYAIDLFCAGTLIFGDLRFLNLSEEEISKDRDDVYSYFTEGNNIDLKFRRINVVEQTLSLNIDIKYVDYACGIGNFVSFLKEQKYWI